MAALLFVSASQAQEIPRPPGDSGKQQQESKTPPPQQQEYKGAPAKPNCEKPHGFEEADLCSQLRMADAAEKALIWAERTYQLNRLQFGALIATVVFAAAAAVAAGFTVRVMRNTAKRQLRAYVSARPNHLFNFDFKTLTHITFEITNHGQTPAYRVAISALVDILPYPLSDNYQFPPLTVSGPSRPTLHNGRPSTGNALATRLFTSQEINDAVNGSQFRIYVFGILRYVDAFGICRETKFCSSVRGGSNLAIVAQLTPQPAAVGGSGAPTLVDIIFEHASQHNEAD